GSEEVVCMSEKRIRITVVAADLFEAASATVGALGLVVGFMNIPISVLNGTPFADFTVPALLLGIVVGGSALVAGIIAVLGIFQLDALSSAAAGCLTVRCLRIRVGMLGVGGWVRRLWWVGG